MAYRKRRRVAATALRRAIALASAAVLTLGIMTGPGSAPAAAAAAPTWGASAVNVLVFHGPVDQQDDPVNRAVAAVRKLGNENGFTVKVSSNPADFNQDNLAKYRGVVFLSANGVTLNDSQEAAFQAYVKGGGGFVGVHDAARAQPASEWFTGLIGSRPAPSLPNAEKVVESAASGQNPPNETVANLFDGRTGTKWLTFATTGWAQGKLAAPTVVNRYALTSANDFAGRDPKNWKLQGSNDGQSWTDLDTRTNEMFQQRFQTRQFSFDEHHRVPVLPAGHLGQQR